MEGRHVCNKSPNSPTFSKAWSGVSFAPHCKKGCVCPNCGERLHAESGNHYCPRCDDFVTPDGKYHPAHG